ncbi:hypothetical protein [Streptococcus parauberis]|uniref:hypothetical protein n=1 Tax=Streptococcus parauberis TaxID=1348 RepID=UPI0002DF3F06|nr:hypothetical protein [Streptococcus parauberis]QBX17865.1 hypothetical protein Javan383_0020 [Streptococcus phage Javan383]UWM90188.1 hypothetical protein N2A94_06720 [Streptococcus parauberis]
MSNVIELSDYKDISQAIVNDNEKHIKKIELINKIIDYWGFDASGDLTEITKEMYETFL